MITITMYLIWYFFVLKVVAMSKTYLFYFTKIVQFYSLLADIAQGIYFVLFESDRK